jgi:ATP-dependent DNA helicase RecG
MNDVPTGKINVETPETVSPQMQKILDFIKINGQITEKEICAMLGIKKTRAYIITKEMCDRNLIQIVGRGETKYYTLR